MQYIVPYSLGSCLVLAAQHNAQHSGGLGLWTRPGEHLGMRYLTG